MPAGSPNLLPALTLALVACGKNPAANPDAGSNPDARADPDAAVAVDAAAPTCTDGIQNGSETGVNCGGTCNPCPDRGWFWGNPGSTHAGVFTFDNEFTADEATIEEALVNAFVELIAAGVNIHPLYLSWAEAETTPGVVDLSPLVETFEFLQELELKPFVMVGLCEGGEGLDVPADLRDAEDAAKFAAPYGWDHPVVAQRFRAYLDALVPMMLEYDGFFLSLGNECDISFEDQGVTADAFGAFIAAARPHVEDLVAQTDPSEEIKVGTTITATAIRTEFTQYTKPMIEASSAIAWNYYCPDDGAGGALTAPIPGELATLLTLSKNERFGDLPVLLQETGCSSGDRDPDERELGSSPAIQAEALGLILDGAYGSDRIRAYIGFKLMDFDDSFVQLFLELFAPGCLESGLPPETELVCKQFEEATRTVGFMWRDNGARKPALELWLSRLASEAP